MTSTEDNRFFFSAWGISLALHGVVVGLALAFVANVKPVLQKEMIQWDVTLMGEARLDPQSEPVKSAPAPEQTPAKKALPSQTKRVAEISQTVRPIEQKILPPQPIVETVQSIEPKVEAPQPTEEPVERRMVEVGTKSVQAAEAKESVAVAALPEPGESQPVQQEPAAIAAVPAPASSQDSIVNEAPGLRHEAQADNRWVGESLWRRVGELKRYPNSARMNGQEGKVILKAVIRSDGHLADVSVQKSSGHSVLDAAAIEAVKLACPLHMKHAIGKPQIVVSLPIVYSLAN
jgi:protein TonB